MRNRVVESFSSEGFDFSSVTIQNKYGKFTGQAFCSPEDFDNDKFSKRVGERYAEIRAHAAFAKFRYKQEKIKKKTIENLIKDIEYFCSEEDKKDNPIYHRARLALRNYSTSTESWENLYKYFENSVFEQDKMREDILSRTRKIK